MYLRSIYIFLKFLNQKIKIVPRPRPTDPVGHASRCGTHAPRVVTAASPRGGAATTGLRNKLKRGSEVAPVTTLEFNPSILL
jgi:hypothetical protein